TGRLTTVAAPAMAANIDPYRGSPREPDARLPSRAISHQMAVPSMSAGPAKPSRPSFHEQTAELARNDPTAGRNHGSTVPTAPARPTTTNTAVKDGTDRLGGGEK